MNTFKTALKEASKNENAILMNTQHARWIHHDDESPRLTHYAWRREAPSPKPLQAQYLSPRTYSLFVHNCTIIGTKTPSTNDSCRARKRPSKEKKTKHNARLRYQKVQKRRERLVNARYNRRPLNGPRCARNRSATRDLTRNGQRVARLLFPRCLLRLRARRFASFRFLRSRTRVQRSHCSPGCSLLAGTSCFPGKGRPFDWLAMGVACLTVLLGCWIISIV